MRVEFQHDPNLLGAIKGWAVTHFPGPYVQARDLKSYLGQTLEDMRKFPYTSKKFLDGTCYRMRVRNRREEWVVDGPCFEEEMLCRMVSSIRAGDVIYDVGAATGTHTIPSAIQTGEEGLAYSFEPDVECAKGLKENLALNTTTNVVIMTTALWREDATLILNTSGRSGAPARVSKASMVNGFKSHQLIQARSIASLVGSGQVKIPDVLKIDVEGAGKAVLQGLGDIHPRHIFMEVHPTMGENREEIVEFLSTRGYQIVWESPRQGELHIHFQL